MKVLQINAVYAKGSTGIIVKDIHEMLEKENIKSYIAFAKANNESKDFYKIGNNLDYKIHGLLTRISGKQAYFSSLNTRGLLDYIDEIEPDIIHLHNLHSNYINLNLLLKYITQRKIKTIITLHDCWFFTGKCFHYEEVDCNKWQTQCGSCPKLKSDVPSWFFDKTSEVFEEKKLNFNRIPNLTVVGVSNWISREAEKSFLKENVIVTIKNGVDLNVFRPRESSLKKKYRIQENFVILGMAEKWLNEKNRIAFNYIVNNLRENEVIILVGCSIEEMRTLPPNVIGIEFVNGRDELAELYSISDVFVNLTLEDSLPTVNIESICCGTPVITYDSGGSPEVIDENTGIVVSKYDFEKVMIAIREIKTKGKKAYQNFCVSRGSKYFNKEDRYTDYIKLYRKLYRE